MGQAQAMRRKGLAFIALLCFAGSSATALAGSVNLTVSPPEENTDGSSLTDLAGFNWYVGCDSQGSYDRYETSVEPSYQFDDLPDTGTCWFVATAFNADGIESGFSNEASKYLGPPNPPTDLRVSDPIAYGVLMSDDAIVLIAVGTVPTDTPCNGEMSVNGHYQVPRDLLVAAGSVEPRVVFALCAPE